MGDIYVCVPPTKMLGGRVPPVPPIIAAPVPKSYFSQSLRDYSLSHRRYWTELNCRPTCNSQFLNARHFTTLKLHYTNNFQASLLHRYCTVVCLSYHCCLLLTKYAASMLRPLRAALRSYTTQDYSTAWFNSVGRVWFTHIQYTGQSVE